MKFYVNRFRSSYFIIRELLHQKLIFQGLVPCYRQLIERTRPFYFRGLCGAIALGSPENKLNTRQDVGPPERVAL